jgi:hypothetical protein
MKKVILISIILIFLTGCGGLYNLNNFVLPDDLGFLTLIEELNTPEKISNYMLENFEYEPHIKNILTPYELYLIKKGDCDDLSNFIRFIANYHNFETYQIKIFYKNTVYYHAIAVFKENNRYNFSDNQYYFLVNYDNFFDIVQLNSRRIHFYYGYIWTKYVVYDYWNNIVERGYNN